MPRMKLLVTDIDETLSRGEQLTPGVISACERLRGNGWTIMVASGRILAWQRCRIRERGRIFRRSSTTGSGSGHFHRESCFETSMDPARWRWRWCRRGGEHPWSFRSSATNVPSASADAVTRAFSQRQAFPSIPRLNRPPSLRRYSGSSFTAFPGA